MRRILLLISLILVGAPTLCAQGSFFGPGPALGPSGRPLAGANVALCAPATVTSGQVISNLAILTMASNPITAGFVDGMTLTVGQFSGGDTYFNGTFTIQSVTSSTITYALTHANASSSTTGTALQLGNSVTSCAGLVATYSDQFLLIPTANPMQADGLGNYGAYAAPGNYEYQVYGTNITTRLFPWSVPCVPGISGCGGSGTGLSPPFTQCLISSLNILGNGATCSISGNNNAAFFLMNVAETEYTEYGIVGGIAEGKLQGIDSNIQFLPDDGGVGSIAITGPGPTYAALHPGYLTLLKITNPGAAGGNEANLFFNTSTNLLDCRNSSNTSCLPPMPTFQTNGTPNGSQSVLNLAAGSNITITDGGSGTVTIGGTGGGGGTTPGGSPGQLQVNVANTTFGGIALGGDCSFSTPNITCTQTNGSAFAASATTDTTNASNISSGTLGHAYLPTLLSGDIPNNAANTSGNAATATSPAGTPSLCSSGEASRGVTTAFAATGCFTPPGGTVTGCGNLSPLFTCSGSTTLTFALSNAAGNSVYGRFSGTSGPPSFGSLTSAMIPNNAANTTGNAATATALAATPSQCTGTNFATGISVSGDANCALPGECNSLFTTLGQTCYAGPSGVASVLAGPTTPNGVPEVYEETPAGSVATAPAWSAPGLVTRAVSISSDTILSTDCNPGKVQYTYSGATAVALPTATTLGVPNCVFRVANNSSGTVTITPATWTINGSSTLSLLVGQIATISVDPAGGNWLADRTEQAVTSGAGISVTRSALGITLAVNYGATISSATGALATPAEVGWVSCTQATCASSATTLFTTGAAVTLYRVDVSVDCTASASVATANIVITYTDPSNTSQTSTAGTAAVCTTLGSASVIQFNVIFAAKNATAIQYNATVANTPSYQARVAIYQEGTN